MLADSTEGDKATAIAMNKDSVLRSIALRRHDGYMPEGDDGAIVARQRDIQVSNAKRGLKFHFGIPHCSNQTVSVDSHEFLGWVKARQPNEMSNPQTPNAAPL